MSAMKLQCCTWPILMARWLLLWMKGWPSTCLHPFSFFFIWAFYKKNCVIECLIGSLKFYLEPDTDLTWKWRKNWFLVWFFSSNLCYSSCLLVFSPRADRAFESKTFWYFSRANSEIDPYDTGINLLDFSDEHIRTKRSSPDKRFKIHATNVDWRKMIGSPDVGASFGVVLKNTLDLKIGKFISSP